MTDMDQIEKLIKQLELKDDISIDDIPSMGLYMEQVTNFLDEKLKDLKRTSNDKILTKTMINNYTKQELLMKSENKKYYKDHIVLMLIIYYLKQILSLEDIKKLIDPILNDMSTTDDDVVPLNTIYDIFFSLKKEEMDRVFEDVEKNMKRIKERTKDLKEDEEKSKFKAQMFLSIIGLIAQAHARKRLAEKMIDEFFK